MKDMDDLNVELGGHFPSESNLKLGWIVGKRLVVNKLARISELHSRCEIKIPQLGMLGHSKFTSQDYSRTPLIHFYQILTMHR
jgi:hypothetical protein